MTSTIVVPIRFPLGSSSVRTPEHAVDLSSEVESAHLYFLHVNLLYRGDCVRRGELTRAVESAIGPHENASYHVRNAFLLEEAILYEAVQQDADYVVIGRDTKAR